MATTSTLHLSRTLLVRQLPANMDYVELQSKLCLLFDFSSFDSANSCCLRQALGQEDRFNASSSAATISAAQLASERLGMRSAVSSIRIVTDPQTGQCAGYAKVDFVSHEQAKLALAVCGDQPALPETNRRVLLSWSQRDGCPFVVDDFQVYVGNLSEDINDKQLFAFAKQYTSSVITAKVILDRLSGKSRGYGFIRYTEDSCAKGAAEVMQPKYSAKNKLMLPYVIEDCFMDNRKEGPAV